MQTVRLPPIAKTKAVIENTVIKCVFSLIGILEDEVVTDCENHKGGVAQISLQARLGTGDEGIFDAVTVHVTNGRTKEGAQIAQIEVVINADPGGSIICVIPGLIDDIQGLTDESLPTLTEKIAVSDIKT